MLSHPSVGRDPESCLRFWRSFVDLRISPLHTKFHSPLSHPSELVSRAFRQFLATFTFNPNPICLSEGRFTAYVPFTPSHSEEHLPPPSYRGCWHGVSRGFFLESCHDRALNERALQADVKYSSSLTRYCWIGLSPIVQDSPLLPPVGVRAVSQSQCG
jgi:hypothetical protein